VKDDLGKLSGPQIRAGITAAALLFCMLLPWYRQSFPRKDGPGVDHDNLNAFGAFSWVEAAVLLVSGAVLYLLYSRTQKKAFHLPGGDGWAVTIAGFWCVFLLVWRLFDRPDIEQGSVGVQWGLFVTMAVAGALAAAGQAMRAEHRPEPPNPAEDPTWEQPGSRRQRDERRRPVDTGAVTRVLGEDRPAWEGDPPEPPRRAKRSEPRQPPDEGRLF
jgi:hypothetical protein